MEDQDSRKPILSGRVFYQSPTDNHGVADKVTWDRHNGRLIFEGTAGLQHGSAWIEATDPKTRISLSLANDKVEVSGPVRTRLVDSRKDPFVRREQSKAAEGKFSAEMGDGHLLLVYEVYSMPGKEADETSFLPKRTDPYAWVRRMHKEGKAKLDTVIALPVRSGQRATVESVDEVIYPIQFEPEQGADNPAFPSAYDMRRMGEVIELDPVMAKDGTHVNLAMDVEFTRFGGFIVSKAQPDTLGVAQPLFLSQSLRTSVESGFDQVILFGTLVGRPHGTGLFPYIEGEDRVLMAFCRPHFIGAGGKPATEADRVAPKANNLHLEFRFHSLPRDRARDLLEFAVDGRKLLEQVRALPEDVARLEHLMQVTTRSGRRTSVDAMAEKIDGSEVTAPKVKSKDGQHEVTLASFRAFEMRPVGWRIEFDPVLSADGTVVELNIAPQRTEYRGVLKGNALHDQYPEQPVFGCQRITTSVAATVGSPCFLGTFNEPGDTGVNGRKDSGRTWFAFVEVTVE